MNKKAKRGFPWGILVIFVILAALLIFLFAAMCFAGGLSFFWFLAAAAMKGEDGSDLFPSTFGGGVGVERLLYALLKGPVIKKIDDVTLFGKNPDSHPIYLF